jgi:monoterpene epsilon-lactone hydrolase
MRVRITIDLLLGSLPVVTHAGGDRLGSLHDGRARSASAAGRPTGILGRVDDEHGARVLAFPQAPDAIELRHLRAFVAVAEELNFGRAAERLYVSQPALSRQIRALERLVGCDLLRRSTHSVELTLAGEALLDRARRLLRDVDAAVTATQSVGGELATRVARMWAPLADVTSADADLQDMRTKYEELHAGFSPPPEVAVHSVIAGGVPGFTLLPPEARDVELLYLHGGGFMMGSAYGFRHLVGALAAAAGTGALVPEYRLAPEHPFPAALEDSLRAYAWLLDRGADPRRVVLAADSAAGGLVLSLLLSVRGEGLAMPGAAVFFCPSVDLSGKTLTDAPADDPMIEMVDRCAAAYLAGHPIDDPIVSPLRADLSGLPPMLIQAATGDLVRRDAHLLAERAKRHGVDARLVLYPGTTHAFQMFWSFLPEGADALHDAGAFVRSIAGPAGAAARRRQDPA